MGVPGPARPGGRRAGAFWGERSRGGPGCGHRARRSALGGTGVGSGPAAALPGCAGAPAGRFGLCWGRSRLSGFDRASLGPFWGRSALSGADPAPLGCPGPRCCPTAAHGASTAPSCAPGVCPDPSGYSRGPFSPFPAPGGRSGLPGRRWERQQLLPVPAVWKSRPRVSARPSAACPRCPQSPPSASMRSPAFPG